MKENTGKSKASTATLIVDTAAMKLYVIGLDSLGARGAQLGSGVTIGATSSDETVATLVPDASPAPDPSGTPTVYSAAITPATPPVIGKPTTLSVVLNTAGVGSSAPVTVDIQFTAGPANSIVLEEL
jgi:hypothetical protein